MDFAKTFTLYAAIIGCSVAVSSGVLSVEALQNKQASNSSKPTCTTLYPGARYWIETRMASGQTISSAQYTIQTESKFCRIQGTRPAR